jgi:hypothetical protein
LPRKKSKGTKGSEGVATDKATTSQYYCAFSWKLKASIWVIFKTENGHRQGSGGCPDDVRSSVDRYGKNGG